MSGSKEYYSSLGAAPGTYRDASADADATNLATATNTKTATKGNPTVAVSARFATAAATCVLTCVLYHKTADDTYTVIGVDTATAEAGSYTLSSLYVAPNVIFDTAGATHYEIRGAATSAGAVTLVAWAFGMQSE